MLYFNEEKKHHFYLRGRYHWYYGEDIDLDSDDCSKGDELIAITLMPFIKCHFHFPRFCCIRDYLRITEYIKCINGQVIEVWHNSANPYACLLMTLANSHHIRFKVIHGENQNIEYGAWDLWYENLTYGSGCHIWTEFSFENILNADFAKFDTNEVELFKKRCEEYEVIDKTLNKAVFSRPLTDIEKLECAQAYLGAAGKAFKGLVFGNYIPSFIRVNRRSKKTYKY